MVRWKLWELIRRFIFFCNLINYLVQLIMPYHGRNIFQKFDIRYYIIASSIYHINTSNIKVFIKWFILARSLISYLIFKSGNSENRTLKICELLESCIQESPKLKNCEMVQARFDWDCSRIFKYGFNEYTLKQPLNLVQRMKYCYA